MHSFLICLIATCSALVLGAVMLVLAVRVGMQYEKSGESIPEELIALIFGTIAFSTVFCACYLVLILKART